MVVDGDDGDARGDDGDADDADARTGERERFGRV